MKLSPSLLSADFAYLYEEAREVEPLVSMFHFDVMDGHFVPNLTFGPPVVNALRPKLAKPFDIHLMIDHPAEYAPQFAVRSGDCITFHIESLDDPRDTVAAIRQTGAKVGVSLRPGTPLDAIDRVLDDVALVLIMSVEPGFGGQAFLPEALERIRELDRRIGGRSIEISVDGGIHAGNVAEVIEAGAEIIVAGSAVFGASDRSAAIRALLGAES